MLDNESKSKLGQRVSRGKQLIGSAWGTTWDEMHPEDRESASKDAISDILTALFGHAGTAVFGEPDAEGFRTFARIEPNGSSPEAAQALLDAAMRSYQGDAEDYIEEGAA